MSLRWYIEHRRQVLHVDVNSMMPEEKEIKRITGANKVERQ